MIVEVSMESDIEKFKVSDWWATSPSFVLHALSSQLDAAKAIWPNELGSIAIVNMTPPPPLPTEPASGVMAVPAKDVA